MQCGIIITHTRTARIGLPLTLVHALDSLPPAAGAAVVEVSWFKQPTHEVSSLFRTLLYHLYPLPTLLRFVQLLLLSSLEPQRGAAKVRKTPILQHFFSIQSLALLSVQRQSINPGLSFSALQGPPCVSLARDVLECWGLNASQRVTIHPEHAL
jgi:hypothetical protein